VPSGKQSKRRRQAVVQAPPTSKRTRTASPRVLIGAAAVVGVVVIAIVLAVVLTGGSSNKSSSGPAAKLPDTTDVQKMFHGIPQSGNVLGKAQAPATLVEYIDLQCPYCQQFETQAMPTLIDKFVRTGKLKVESRPIAIIGPDSETGRKAVVAAGVQNRLFNFAQLLYDNQGTENTGWLNDSMIRSAAASIPGLDTQKLFADQNSSTVKDELKKIDGQAQADSVNSTPTILVGRSGSKPKVVSLSSPTDTAAVESAINAALGGY
jgi:protein-disulfide isomerase